MTGTGQRRLRVLLPVLATVALLAPLVYLWQASLVPKRLTVQEMGYADYGGRVRAPTVRGRDTAKARPVRSAWTR